VSYQFSNSFNAPLRFVYNWCTDYSEVDPKITGAKLRRIIIEKTKKRAVYINQQKNAKAGMIINIVTLHPPDSWHLNLIGKERDGTGEYHLTKIGPRSTKLHVSLKMRWKTARPPTKPEFHQRLNSMWAKYAAALERDYKRKA
jgi:hypothetical protein